MLTCSPNLENSIGLALTVVFVLPELSPVGSDKMHNKFGASESERTGGR
jgi:hypothetical protein